MTSQEEIFPHLTPRTVVDPSSDPWAHWGALFYARYPDPLSPVSPHQQVFSVLLPLADNLLPFSSSSTGTILDICCGSGDNTIAILSSYSASLPKSARIICSDLSPGMISLAKSRFENYAKETGKGSVEAKIWDATNLSEVQSNSVSHVISTAGIFLCPEKAILETHRVLQTGGVLATTSMIPSRCAWSYIFFPDPFPKSPLPRECWYTAEGVKEELAEKGFKDVQAKEVEMWMDFEERGAEEIVRWLVDAMPFTGPMTKGMSAEEKENWVKGIVERVERDFPNKKLPGVAICAVGRK